jgi:hypothetical protein
MIEATPGGATANSYVTLAEAEAYFATRLGAEPWTMADAATRESALRMATRALERLRWPGARQSTAQALSWPRTGVAGVADGVLPQAVRDAQCEEALAWLTPALTRRRYLQAAGVTTAQVADAREQYAPGDAGGLLSADARALLCGLVALGGCLVTDAGGVQ